MNKSWTFFKYLIAFGFVVYPAGFYYSFMTMWESGKAGDFVMVGYTLLIVLSLIIALINSKKILLRILSYLLIVFWLIGVFSFVNQILYDYFRTGFYS